MTEIEVITGRGDNAEVYHSIPNHIWVREWNWRDMAYDDPFPVEIPKRFASVSFVFGERILIEKIDTDKGIFLRKSPVG